MKLYFDSVKSKLKQQKLKYIPYRDAQKFYVNLSTNTQVSFFDPLDFDLQKKLNTLLSKPSRSIKITVIDNPDLLISKDVLWSKYFIKHKNNVRHASFYEFVKQELGVLPGIKNLDKENRSPPPKNAPHIYSYKTESTNLNDYYREAIDYVDKTFVGHYGNTSNVQQYPITNQQAKQRFNSFLKDAFGMFGKYEDAVMKEDPFMYHSVISPMLNTGLLNPREIIDITVSYYKQHKDKIPLASFEGFIRQVIGWRFMMQSMYIFRYNDLYNSNLPNNKNKFRDYKIWYTGNTGIVPLDEEIKKAQEYGYAHHIVRLMIFMNFFILCELHPYEIYKWFMEVVSLDAYSWVMISNVYAMGYFYPKMMTKPYISTSNYVVKMTNYKKDGHWDVIWDALYHDFLRKKPKEYTFFYKRTFKDDPNMKKIAEDFKHKYFVG
jgi:deoxyribodipyrimidine photolyase-related protein